jgi:ATP-dependent helicase HrpA
MATHPPRQSSDPFADLLPRLDDLSLRDRARLRRRVEGARKVRRPEAVASIRAEIEGQIAAGEARVAARRATVPELNYPENLPVSQLRGEILAAIRDHQVVIVAGETGSGKTTQIPKICLELGRGVHGLIGHTQPRRLAARTVAERIAEELKTSVGQAVGYKVRFTDQGSQDTLVKLMTDGILLAELQHDRQLLQYDTLIIDEAHERSLNIDFILGYLKQLLPSRPDLKVVITSATIDPQRFSAHFGDAPIVEVSGRTYPVEVRYRPIVDLEDPDGTVLDGGEGDRDQIQAICDAVEELGREAPGDILVFLSGEREIRDTAEALNRQSLPFTEVIPLYARLSSAEQHLVFQPHSGRRIVLATNVAETSLTVPGIKYVIDPGTARISRYSHRLKVQRLPIEPVSQASANQRAGRCGRTSDGICVRLFSEADFAGRPEFTEPEILRTNLASVILQMTSIGLGDIAAFPFVEAPDRRNIKDGIDLLYELGALKEVGEEDRRGLTQRSLTETGRKIARLPVDPRLARMMVEAERLGCLNEITVIASALSIQDPRERPVDKQPQAAQSHARFVDKDQQSDFLTYLRLWEYLREQRKALSSNQFRKMCKAEFLHYLRIREWQDLHSQLRQVAKDIGATAHETVPADPATVHQAVLSGLLSHIGLYEQEKREYVGARNAKFAVFPGSSLFKKSPRWVMAAELVETSRLWGRVAAKIEPEWIESLAEHLIKRSYSEPHWSKSRGAAQAYEKVTLYGLPIVAQRLVDYGRIDPDLSRELFIQHALVQGEWQTHHKFFQANQKLLEEVGELEERARRRDIVVHDDALFAFYDQRVGKEVVSARHFDSWWKKKQREQPELLNFERAMLINESADTVREADYPDVWRQGKLRFPLTYQFEPGADADGVTVHVPLAVLNQVEPDGFDWQIPGLREELVTALIRSLPKPIRRSFVLAPNYAKFLLDKLPAKEGRLLDGLEQEMLRMGSVRVEREDWDLDRLPDYLKMTFRVVDERDRKVAEDKDLAGLKLRLAPKVRASISAAADDLERTGARNWEFGQVARTFERRQHGVSLKAYPALVDEGGSVGLRLLDTAAEQEASMVAGTRRLLLLTLPSPVKSMLAALDNREKLALGHNPYGPVPALFEDCVACAVDYLVEQAGGPVWTAEDFAALRDKVRADVAEVAEQALRHTALILDLAHQLERRLKGTTSLALLPSLSDVQNQLAGLIPRGFISLAGYPQLSQFPRYLRAIDYRLDKLPDEPYRDQLNLAKVDQLRREYDEALARVPRGARPSGQLRQVRWMLEEFRVSLFAQQLGTAYPVSEKRIRKAISEG